MIEDVVVVGGGPAGAACALWAHQLGLRVVLVETESVIGGLHRRSPYVNRWVPGVQGRTGEQVAESLQAHLEAASVRLMMDFHVTSIAPGAEPATWEVSSEGRTLRARCVVIATGSRPRREGFVEGERVGIGPGVSMERLAVAGRRVAILGGGDNAFDQAAFALRRGACSVDIYCRRAPRAKPLLQAQVAAGCVHVGPFHADPARMTVDGEAYDILGVQFGFEACVPEGLRVPTDEGCIRVDRRGAVPGFRGLYAAGKVTNFWHPCVVTSYAHGVQVAKSIHAVLQGASTAAAGETPEPDAAPPSLVRGPAFLGGSA